MGDIGGFEWVIIILVVLLFFGANKIPDLARGIGQGIREFRKASDDIRNEIERGKSDVSETTNSIKNSVTGSTQPNKEQDDGKVVTNS